MSSRNLARPVRNVVMVIGVIVAAGILWVAQSQADPKPRVRAAGASGAIAIRDSRDGAAIFSATHLVPGRGTRGDVTISNSGNSPGRFRLSLGRLTEKLGRGGAALSRRLRLTVTRVGGDRGASIYTGPLSDLGVRQLGILAPKAARTYRFSVTFPDGGGHGADNALQGGSVNAQFLWAASAVKDPPAGPRARRLTVKVTPKRVVARHPVTVRVLVRTRRRHKLVPVARARIRVAGRRARTDRRGRITIRFRRGLASPGAYRVRISRSGYRTRRVSLRARSG